MRAVLTPSLDLDLDLDLDGLDQAVEAFENAVGELAFKPTEQAVPMLHEGVGGLDQGR